jgi:ribosomal protein L11 methyltransferase
MLLFIINNLFNLLFIKEIIFSTMPWLQLELEATPEFADLYSDYLTEAGASAVTFQDAADQPLFEPRVGETPLWPSIRVTGLFDTSTNFNKVIKSIKSQLGDNQLPNWHLNPLEDRDWTRAWMDNFKPMKFGKQLWICPGEYSPPQPDAVNLILDPGLAFGTGTHPTTAMCLTWLANHPPQHLDVIDYGCGSGVLAIAACLLGANSSIAIDNDPQALIATHDNAIKNSVTDKIEVYLPDQISIKPVSLVIANILAGPLIELESTLADLVLPGGMIVLSGILAEQASSILETYTRHFDVKIQNQMEEWVCITGKKQ